MLVGCTTLRRLKFFLVAPRTPYFDILWSKPSAIAKKVGKNFCFKPFLGHLLTGYFDIENPSSSSVLVSSKYWNFIELSWWPNCQHYNNMTSGLTFRSPWTSSPYTSDSSAALRPKLRQCAARYHACRKYLKLKSLFSIQKLCIENFCLKIRLDVYIQGV